jgi:hypothetical protein
VTRVRATFRTDTDGEQPIGSGCAESIFIGVVVTKVDDRVTGEEIPDSFERDTLMGRSAWHDVDGLRTAHHARSSQAACNFHDRPDREPLAAGVPVVNGDRVRVMSHQ